MSTDDERRTDGTDDPTLVLPADAVDDAPDATPTVTFEATPAETVTHDARAAAPTTDAPAVDATAPAPAPARAPEGPERYRPRLRVSTVVWGLVIATVGVGLLAWASGFSIDVQLAVIVLLGAAGAALLLGSIVSGARHSRR